MKKTDVELIIDDMFHKHAYGVTFNIMHISLVRSAIRKSINDKEDVEKATKEAIEKYRVREN